MATFGDALEKMKNGKQAKRENWGAKWIAILDPGPNAEMTSPYFYLHAENGDQEPWAPSHKELLAEDWGAA
jgi:hypothetical protein